MKDEDWASLILKRAIERNQPTLTDLLEIYGSYNILKKELQANKCNGCSSRRNTTDSKSEYTHRLDTREISASSRCALGSPRDPPHGNLKGKDKESKASYSKFLESRLLELQRELTNSYRNKSNFDNSLNSLKERIEQLETQLKEKEVMIKRLKHK